ncbi:MAG: hypothetical protein IPO40_23850 [Fibrobacteres bacterium]|nr:hypothetical protein [Fibrobacterota bacterium]
MRHYWGYRINVDEISFFRSEVDNYRLRQGWGWDPRQDLRNLSLDEGARRNLAIFNKVKKGDILLIPRLPTWEEVAIIEAIDDFSSGYDFRIDESRGDYGHIFPAKLLKSFTRNNENISGNIRASIKNISRFWNMDQLGLEIEELIRQPHEILGDDITFEKRFKNSLTDSFQESFDARKFSRILYEKMTRNFRNEEWEYALVEGLGKIFPPPMTVQRVGGISEVMHGTDILIKIPGLLSYQYGIAIQIKDYEGVVGKAPLDQLNKADSYWGSNAENLKIIDKILIVIKANSDNNEWLLEQAGDIKIVFAKELMELLDRIGKMMIGIPYE